MSGEELLMAEHTDEIFGALKSSRKNRISIPGLVSGGGGGGIINNVIMTF